MKDGQPTTSLSVLSLDSVLLLQFNFSYVYSQVLIYFLLSIHSFFLNMHVPMRVNCMFGPGICTACICVSHCVCQVWLRRTCVSSCSMLTSHRRTVTSFPTWPTWVFPLSLRWANLPTTSSAHLTWPPPQKKINNKQIKAKSIWKCHYCSFLHQNVSMLQR